MSIQRDRVIAWTKTMTKYQNKGYKKGGYFLFEKEDMSRLNLDFFIYDLHFMNTNNFDLVGEDCFWDEFATSEKLDSLFVALMLLLQKKCVVHGFTQDGFEIETVDYDGNEYENITSKKLPQAEGVYLFTWYRTDNYEMHDPSLAQNPIEIPLYVGKTSDLSSRFANHHRLDEIKFLYNMGESLFFYFIPFYDHFKVADLGKLEGLLIEMLMPVLNGTEYLSSNKNGIVKLKNSQPLLSSFS